MTKNNGLIGYTGLVGQNILQHKEFDDLYNSTNIEDIKGKEFDLLICSGARGNRRFGDMNPKEDKNNIDNLIFNLKYVRTKKLILISTIEVYNYNTNMDEDYIINIDELSPYAKHRALLELYCKDNFDCLIVRLPIIFGIGTKKNIIYDLIHKQYNFVNKNSIFQFYDLVNIWKDINIALKHDINIINLFSEPIGATEMAKDLFGVELKNTNEDLRQFDMSSKYWKYWKSLPGYLYTKEQIYNSINYYKEYNLI